MSMHCGNAEMERLQSKFNPIRMKSKLRNQVVCMHLLFTLLG